MSEKNLGRSASTGFLGLASLKIHEQPMKKVLDDETEFLKGLDQSISPTQRTILDKELPSQKFKRMTYRDFNNSDIASDMHQDLMLSSSHFHQSPQENSLYKVMIDNMEERNRRKRELKAELESFKTENQELRDRISELLAKLVSPTVSSAEVDDIKKELAMINQEKEKLRNALHQATYRAVDLGSRLRTEEIENEELRKKLAEFILNEDIVKQFRNAFQSGSHFSKYAPIVINQLGDNKRDIIKCLRLLGELSDEIGASPTNKFYQALLLYYWGKSKYKEAFYQALLEVKGLMNRLLREALVDDIVDIRLRGRTLYGELDPNGNLGNNYCLLLLELFRLWKMESPQHMEIFQQMFQRLLALEFLVNGIFDKLKINIYQDGFECLPILEKPPQEEGDQYVEQAPQEKVNTKWHQIKVLGFYLYNIFKTLVIGMIGALTISGITDDTKRDYVLVFVGIYLILTVISLCIFYSKRASRYNYWTAAVLVESYRMRKICKFFQVFIILFTLIQGIVDWAKCQNDPNSMVGLNNDTSCSGVTPAFNFILSLVLSLIGLNSIMSYTGPYFESMPLSHKVFYKLDMGFEAFTKDSAQLLKDLRVISYITKSDSLEFTVTSTDVPWNMVNYLTREDKLKIYNYFENQSEEIDESDPDYDEGPIPYVILGCIIPSKICQKRQSRKTKIAELRAKAEEIYQSRLVKVDRKPVAQLITPKPNPDPRSIN